MLDLEDEFEEQNRRFKFVFRVVAGACILGILLWVAFIFVSIYKLRNVTTEDLGRAVGRFAGSVKQGMEAPQK